MSRTRSVVFALVGVLGLFLAVSAFAGEIGVNKEQTYQEALRCLKIGNYDEAYSLFESLETYNDSTDYKLYTEALINMRQEKYEEAIVIFEVLALNEFMDSVKYERYARGRKAEMDWDAELARACYTGLGFLDSNERLMRLPTPVPPSQTPESTPSPTPDRPHVFIDQAMGEAIRKKLNKPSGVDVYLSELAQIETLERKYTEKKGIQSLEDLRHCVNLTVLFVEDNKGVSDLTPLSGLTSLRRLWIQKNSISDLSPLAGLVELRELGICHNQVSDLSPLANMMDLAGVYLNSNTRISDLSPLDNKPLEYFQYGNNKLSNDEINRFKKLHPDCTFIKKKT